MLNYRNLNILFFIAILTLIVVSNYYTVGIIAYIILISVYVLLIAIGAFSIRQNFYFKSLNLGNTSKKEIALTFDDGPHPKITPEVLNLLDAYAVKATFFCIGKRVDDHKEIVKEADKRGHIIGNHSYHHGHLFDLQSSVKMTHELNQARNSIYHAIGKMANLFRPPFGVTNPLLKIAVSNANLISIGWSIRSFDTNRSQEYVISRLKSKIHPGAIILLHDSKEKVIPILKAFLPWLQQNGYQVVSLEKLLHIKAYETI